MDNTDTKVLSLLGLERRAGKLVSGGEKTEKSVKSGAAFMVIVTEDASDNTKKLFFDKCGFYEVPVFCHFLMDDMGRAIGGGQRACLAICDEGFADKIMKLMTDSGQEVFKWQN